MEEPSILDYLKSRLQFWKREGRIELPQERVPAVEPGESRFDLAGGSFAADDPSLQESDRGQSTISTLPQKLPKQNPAFTLSSLPWRSLLALVFVLLAQRSFEPTENRTPGPGLILYAIGLAWLVFAWLRGEWTPSEVLAEAAPTLQPANSSKKRIRLFPLILTVLFSVAAFIAYGGNHFTPLNLALGLAALACFLWTFLLPGPGVEPWWKRLLSCLRRDQWNLRVSRYGLLLLAVIGLVIFFRVYSLGSVPSEPFSDHAEKILDVYELTQGETLIFFPRNTGREAIQMYLTALVSWLFGTGLSYLSLKIGTVICGLLTLPYVYLLGKELGGRRVALLALLLAGIAYWPNVISRAGLRFPLYPLFVAPTLYYLIRGLRRNNRNDFIYAGIALGLGLHGYSPIRILPFVVVIAVGLFLLHSQSKGRRQQVMGWLVLLASVSFILFLPLLRFGLEYPDLFGYRAFSRLGSTEAPIPGPVWKVLLSNLWNGLKMFQWDDGEIWVHSITHRPALDVVSGALLMAGVLLLILRYIRKRHWLDLFLLVSIPLLQLPSTLSLAFPAENPALNRAGGALVPVFLVAALALDGLWNGIQSKLKGRGGALLAWFLSLLLVGWASFQNYTLVFTTFADQFKSGAWNTSEMGAVIKQFGLTYGNTDNAWIIPYPHWVDTRLPGVWAGVPNRDFAVWPENLETTLDAHGAKLFIVKLEDATGREALEALYPQGIWSTFTSSTGLEGKDFLICFIPPEE